MEGRLTLFVCNVGVKDARQVAEIADLKTRLDTALAIINAQATQIKTRTERIVQLENATCQTDASKRDMPDT